MQDACLTRADATASSRASDLSTLAVRPYQLHSAPKSGAPVLEAK